MKHLAALAATLMACGDDGSHAVDAAVALPDAPVEACTGGVDEDADAFTDCDDDDCWDDPACYQIDDPTDLPAPTAIRAWTSTRPAPRSSAASPPSM